MTILVICIQFYSEKIIRLHISLTIYDEMEIEHLFKKFKGYELDSFFEGI